ncbi:MAG TPA: PocR ligand-binding domain-containing protein [Melioribacteraceae bacterium]|nr:PocR ligand-binding domain-containing protein [Melioribacteraceae bacterium]
MHNTISLDKSTTEGNRFKALFDNMQEGFLLHKVIYDDNGKAIDYLLIEANKGFTNHTGIDFNSIRNKKASEVYRINPPPFLDIYANVAKTGEPIKFEDFAPSLNKYYSISAFSPEPEFFATVFLDITEQKLLEKALEEKIYSLTRPLTEEAEIRFEDLFNIEEIQQIQDSFAEATGVASLITDTKGVPITKPSKFVFLCNEVIRKTEKGLKNCMHSDACLGKLNPNGPIYQPCLSGGLWDGGTSITAGNKHVANWLIGQVLDESHDREKMLNYAYEIEADPVAFKNALNEVPIMSKERFKKICDALFVLAKQLSKMALQNMYQARFITDLKQKEDIINKQVAELESKNAELERFAYTVSHDLKSPLITIKGFLGMIQKDVDNERFDRVKSDLNRIANATDKMQNLLEDLLELSRIGRVINPSSHFSLTDIAKESVELLNALIKGNNVEIEISEQMPVVFADRLRIREVYQNLIENAVKFRDKNKKLIIKIGCNKQLEKCIYYIKDNGIGIERGYLNKIFGLFDKLDPKSEGTGIGLAIVKRIIELHGGKIWAESEGVGFGTTFYFTIK